jgi:hypothetical protein
MEEDKTEILKKTLGHNTLQFQDGEFSIWGVPSMITPLNTYLMLEKMAGTQFGKDFIDLTYYVAKRQTMSGMEILHKHFGFKDMRKSVELELQTSAMIGVGVCSLLRYDEKNKHAHIKISPNPLAKMYLKIFGLAKEPVDNWSRGSLAGIFTYAFGTNVEAIEISCSAMGKPYCQIEVKPEKEWDFGSEIVRNQLPGNEDVYQSLADKITASIMKSKP